MKEYRLHPDGEILVSNEGDVIYVRSKYKSNAGAHMRGKYLGTSYKKDGHKKHISIHRLVAETFIPNPNNYPAVNHIDGNTRNNRVDNLEWVTYSQNTQHAYRIGLVGAWGKNRPKVLHNPYSSKIESVQENISPSQSQENVPSTYKRQCMICGKYAKVSRDVCYECKHQPNVCMACGIAGKLYHGLCHDCRHQMMDAVKYQDRAKKIIVGY